MDEEIEIQNIGKKAFYLSISKTIVITITMIVSMFLSRYLSLEEYGTYSQIIIIVELFVTLLILGLPNSINYFLAKTENKEDQKQFVSVYYSLSIFLSIIIGLVLILTSPIIANYFKNPLLSNFVYVLAILPWTKIMLSSIENILIVYNKTNMLIKFKIINSILILLNVIAVGIFSLSFYQYMLIFIIIQSVFTIVSFFIANGLVEKIVFSLNKQLVTKIFKYSLPIGLASMLGIIKKEFDKLMIGGFYDTSSLAIYTNAAKELPITVISASLTAILIPQMVKLFKKEKTKEAVSLWKDTTELSYFFVCLFAVGIFVFAPEVMSILYSSKYIEGATIFRIYSLVLLFRCTYFGMVLSSIGKTKLILYSSIIVLVLNVILNFVFYYIIGFSGPALSTLLVTLISASIQLVLTSRVIKVSIKELFPWKKIVEFSLINVVFGIIFYLIKENFYIYFFNNKIIFSLVLGVLWATIYFMIYYKYIKSKYKKINK